MRGPPAGPGGRRRSVIKQNRRLALLPLGAVILLAALFAVYVSDYYPADADARAALASDEAVTVERTDYGWRFDGPSEDTALIFYPGAKVEETAYAPFLRRLAGDGMDVCLVKMPFRLAVFDKNAASDILPRYPYETWYVGGHSLGGAMAADWAADHGEAVAGVVLCAAYPTKPLDPDLTEILVYGSQDGVLRREKLAEGEGYAPARYVREEIPGGNHAQFGSYGPQTGDGEAAISPEAQQARAAAVILDTARAGADEAS